MNIYDIAGIFTGIGIALTAVRYFIKKPENILLCFLQNAVGTFFIFSGYIKLIDPLGFSYKLTEYWQVFNLPFLEPLSFSQSCFITCFEVILGVALLLGLELFWTTLFLLLMIVFFLFLTWYSAYFNKVTDCGCFGDFMHLKPWETFWKDVVLVIMILPLFIFRNKISGWWDNKKKLTATLVGIAIIGFASLQYVCYNHLPIHDFRAYKIGTDISQAMKVPDDAPQDVYETTYIVNNLKTNKKQNMTTAEYFKIWKDTLTYDVDSSFSKLIQEGYHAPIHDFDLTLPSGTNVTDSLLNINGNHFFVIMYDAQKTDATKIERFNNLYNECKAKGISFVALMSGAGVENFVQQNKVQFPYVYCDGTALKTMIRSNPGLILLNKSTVKNMWHANDVTTLNNLIK
jgi:uncharacterized membrane protein YphA (DoxX/SURF4 family)